VTTSNTDVKENTNRSVWGTTSNTDSKANNGGSNESVSTPNEKPSSNKKRKASSTFSVSNGWSEFVPPKKKHPIGPANLLTMLPLNRLF